MKSAPTMKGRCFLRSGLHRERHSVVRTMLKKRLWKRLPLNAVNSEAKRFCCLSRWQLLWPEVASRRARSRSLKPTGIGKRSRLIEDCSAEVFHLRALPALLRTRFWYMMCRRDEKVRERRCCDWSCSWRDVRNDRDVRQRTSCASCLLGA